MGNEDIVYIYFQIVELLKTFFVHQITVLVITIIVSVVFATKNKIGSNTQESKTRILKFVLIWQ